MTPQVRVRLFELEPEIAGDLTTALSKLGTQLVNERPQVIFCSVSPSILQKALKRFPKLPVVVVSRLPEVRAWLDALEAGAADYCAAPFESIHLNWILSNQLGARAAAA
jgi:DNA-binding NtrC family response regulator